MEKTKKNDRTNSLAIACVVACFSFAYGFSNQNSLFQWKLPLAIMLVTSVWAFLPRFIAPRESSENS
jgi:hypothetical protein